MATVRDIKKIVETVPAFKCFTTTVNSRGNILVSIVSNSLAKNKNGGQVVYSKKFVKFFSVSAQDLSDVELAVNAEYIK